METTRYAPSSVVESEYVTSRPLQAPKGFLNSEDEFHKEIVEIFELFDANKQGSLDCHELKAAMCCLSYNASDEVVMEILQKYDPGNTGKISFKHFTTIMLHWFREQDPRHRAFQVFELFDKDKKGKINTRDLKQVAKELGDEIGDEDLASMISEFDTDGDGEINLDDFLKIMYSDI